MSHSSDSFLIEHPNRLTASMHTIIRVFRKLSFHPVSISELLLQLEEVTSPVHLTRTVNRAQNLLWNLPSKEQGAFRQNLVNVLGKHVLQGAQEEMRLEAAGWLRLFVQAGQVTQPADIFVTLVTAAIHAPLSHHTSLASTHNPPPAEANQGERKIRGTPPFPWQGASPPAPPLYEGMSNTSELNEQQVYLKMIFECFWPFRHPYPAYTWQVLPTNEVFYPLAPLFDQADYATQDALIGIYGELPALDDAEILEHLLPVALQWSRHAYPERRRRVANILAHINQESAQEALCCLQSDSDPDVRESAKSAAGYVRIA